MVIPHRDFLGLPVTTAAPTEIVKWIIESALHGKTVDVHLLESNGIAIAEMDSAFESLLRESPLVVPDGRWLSILTRRTSSPLTQLRGEDLFTMVLRSGLEHSLRHFFIGSTESKVNRLRQALSTQMPTLEVVGTYCPPFGPMSEEDRIELSALIRQRRPHIVWLGISTPRQDFEAQQLARDHSLVTIPVGAAFEFVSGDKRSAPGWMKRAGLEWFFRLLSEPRRLIGRYVRGTTLFFWRFLKFEVFKMSSGEATT